MKKAGYPTFKILTHCWKVFCQMRTDDERWYWQL